MTIPEERWLAEIRSRPECEPLVRGSYFDADLGSAWDRFCESAEFQEVEHILQSNGDPKVILDLGAGRGIASYAFSRNPARTVIALEPDASRELGRGALYQIPKERRVSVIEGAGEDIPLPNNSVDAVYARQVLHHARDLRGMMREVSRVLQPGGLFLACREHVVSSRRQLEQFLRNHDTHRWTCNEHAYRVEEYTEAIVGAGLTLKAQWGPWESLLNAYPALSSAEDLSRCEEIFLSRKFGATGRQLARVRFIRRAYRVWLNRPTPGRLFSFLATKPAA